MIVPIRVVVQARMSSRRFPGKVLAPFRGRPVFAHVRDAVRQALPDAPLLLATSDEPSDDPLALYARDLGVEVYRGALSDVLGRFQAVARLFPSQWILRLCSDSPLLDPVILQKVAETDRASGFDLVTTLHPRTFPKGRNAELIRTSALQGLPPAELSAEDREHVTPYFYRHAAKFRILSLVSGRPELAEVGLAIDSVEDLQRLENLSESDLKGWSAPPRFQQESSR